MKKKRCTKCNRTDVRFHKRKEAKDGLKSQCVECTKIYKKEYTKFMNNFRNRVKT
ncbi:hypothetical protein LCGC14_1596650 [marine sediment metagenome]|uniref:Uncharacterized protein n=1 Tax=marine sediment metagenome TaxID=412755 RepID=A0A0F9ICS5_9ZZZZ